MLDFAPVVQRQPRVSIPTMEGVVTMQLSKGFQDALQYLGSVKGFSRATLTNYERTGLQFLAYLRNQGREDSVRSFTIDTVLDFATYLGQRKAS